MRCLLFNSRVISVKGGYVWFKEEAKCGNHFNLLTYISLLETAKLFPMILPGLCCLTLETHPNASVEAIFLMVHQQAPHHFIVIQTLFRGIPGKAANFCTS